MAKTKTADILRLHEEGEKVSAIAKTLKMSRPGVYSTLRRHGVKVAKSKTQKLKTDTKKKSQMKRKEDQTQRSFGKVRAEVFTRPGTNLDINATEVNIGTVPTSSSNVVLQGGEGPNPIVSIYTPLTVVGLLRKLSEQLVYLQSRIAEVEKIKAAIEKI